ncbi:hypothetical protein MUN89_20080 [Halobacillus salinarum]|uniref:Uncharacterized protein n=1 Tax=Halobacillus salinarum TaxID=2932257 RepID=A0ABY4EKH4_9BACI|nr:hypothetical protein [Halobacillus salinarum]UOQ44129.1 hypothetical protein MUN89_20080 [Halobacillus salinarum]
MDRETIHEKILLLKGKICSGQISFNGNDDYIILQLDKVKESEDGLVDMNTVSSSLITLIHVADQM